MRQRWHRRHASLVATLIYDDEDVFDVVEVLLHLIHVGADVDREHLEPCLDLDDNCSKKKISMTMMEVLLLLSALDSWSLDTRCDGPRLVGVDLHCKERREEDEGWKRDGSSWPPI